MLVRDVMSADFLVVRPTDSALEVGNLMDSKNIGAAAVVDNGEFRGVLSKETFVAHIHKVAGRPLSGVSVSELMEEDVDYVRPDYDLTTAVEIFTTQKGIVDLLPVLESQKVVGLLTKGDITRLFMERMKGRYKVRDLMHYGPVTVPDYTPLDEVVEEMMKATVKRVLVMSGDSLAGIISVRDLSLILFRERKRADAVEPRSTLTAADIMTRNPVTVKPKADASEAAKIMVERRFGGIPVIDRKLEGIITRTDLLKGYQLGDR
jgi:CBS domain-containing protein